MSDNNAEWSKKLLASLASASGGWLYTLSVW